MADSNKVAQFVSITGCDPSSAAFFLESTDGDVEAAVEAYYESGSTPAGSGTGSATAGASSSSPMEEAGPIRRSGKASGKSRQGGIATLGSLGGDDSEEEESGKNYYAGGEKSGQMIQDPRKESGGGNEGNDVTSSIFERARQMGPMTDAEKEEFRSRQMFTGAGYRLGTEESVRPARPTVMGRRNVTRTLTFYANGFTVDDGPLRSLDDPANREFLHDIDRGHVPREMEEPGIGKVSINLVDKKGEEYIPPKPKLVPFSGGGHRLGSGTEAVAAAAATPVDTEAAAAAVKVDESRPVATIQVRLCDGTRIVARLNDDATVGDLREYVRNSRPAVLNFTLATAFPRKVLNDDSTTLKEAKLSGSVVVQTLSG